MLSPFHLSGSSHHAIQKRVQTFSISDGSTNDSFSSAFTPIYISFMSLLRQHNQYFAYLFHTQSQYFLFFFWHFFFFFFSWHLFFSRVFQHSDRFIFSYFASTLEYHFRLNIYIFFYFFCSFDVNISNKTAGNQAV